jgi:hypothetical protein
MPDPHVTIEGAAERLGRPVFDGPALGLAGEAVGSKVGR